MPKKQEDRIQSILVSIDETLKQQNSTKQVFLQGLVRGFGTALGATVLVAIITSFTIKIFDSFDAQEFTKSFFTDIAVE